jgi:hypothetical protein
VDAALQHLRTWTARRWLVAAAASVVVALLVGLPTDVIPNPVFGRPVPVTWWSYPVLVVTALLGGLLAATYVREPGTATGSTADDERPARRGGVAGLLSFFAVGCPVCNKLVVIALGTVGARRKHGPRHRSAPLLDVRDGELVTRVVFPWQAAPTNIPTQVSKSRKTPHPEGAACPPLPPSDVRSVALQSTPSRDPTK